MKRGILYSFPARNRVVGLSCVWLVSLLAGGCLSRVHYTYPEPPCVDRSGAARLAALPASWEEVRVTAAGEDGSHRVFALEMPSAGKNGQDGNLVTATYYQGTGGGHKRLVLMLPIWGSSEYPPRSITRRLLNGQAGAQTNILYVYGAHKLFDLQTLESAATETEFLAEIRGSAVRVESSVADLKRLLDWAEAQGDVDPDRIGIVGFSIGAIVGSLVMGQDSRVDAGVLVLGGAHLHEIFGNCRGAAGRVRRSITGRFGWTEETYQRKIEAPLASVDPAHWGRNVHPSQVLLFDATYDHCIPESARTDLWEAMGRPERISLRYGHKIAFLSMSFLGFNYTSGRIVDFLDRRLLPRHAGGAPLATCGAPRSTAAR